MPPNRAMKFARFGFLLSTLKWAMTLAGEGHGEHAFEWAGIFETPENDYLWTAQKVNEQYADASMKLVALPATSITEEGLHALEEQGEEALNLTCTELQNGGTIIPATNTCYKLIFKQSVWQSLYNVDASSVTGIAFFTEHVPTEFEATAHYLKDDHGHDIEPKATLPETSGTATTTAETEWAAPMLASLLVNMVTFIGVILLFPPVKRLSANPFFGAVLFAFAAGALLACAFFLLLFEATHLVATGWTAEVDVLWRWGAMILAGMVVPPVVETLCTLIMLARDPGQASAEQPVENGEMSPEKDAGAKFRSKARLVGAVVIGDFFHNLCDGFFIGAAFQGCGNAFGWSVAAGTILHELPQEIADFVVLTSSDVGFGTIKALVANVCSGLSVLIGAAIVLSAQVDNSVIGLFLAFGGGVYLHIGATDCLPKMYNPKLSLCQRLAAFSSFVLGTVVIGLILIGHEHCVPAGDEGHHNHGHGH